MLQTRFLHTLQKFRMLEKGETVLIAVSGGRDSVTLFHLFNEIRGEWKLRLGILHANHQLRGEASNRDETFVRQLGRKFKLPVYAEALDARKMAQAEKMSLEEAARAVRYRFFERIAESKHADKVALAHNRDDQAETVLMRILGGTGLQGLQAIRPKRKLNGAYLIRPLLEIPREEIRFYVKENKIRFREDASNRSLKFLRNRIRLRLIPMLEKEYNPQVKRALARLPHLLDVDLAFLEETALLFYKRLARQRTSDEIIFPKQSFLQLRPSIQYRLLARAVRTLAEADLDFDHWNSFADKALTERQFRAQLPKGVLASVTSEEVRIRRGKSAVPHFSYSLAPGEERYVPEMNATIVCEELKGKARVLRKSDSSYEIFDGGRLEFPLQVRNREHGDRFQPLGQSKPLKLKGFLINKRIPADDRDRLPLVVSGKLIAWVGGVAISDYFKVIPETKRFIRISMRRGNST